MGNQESQPDEEKPSTIEIVYDFEKDSGPAEVLTYSNQNGQREWVDTIFLTEYKSGGDGPDSGLGIPKRTRPTRPPNPNETPTETPDGFPTRGKGIQLKKKLQRGHH